VLCKIRYDGLSQCFAIPVVSEVAASAVELSERCSALSWQAGRQAFSASCGMSHRRDCSA
jgi:hypothetical protein